MICQICGEHIRLTDEVYQKPEARRHVGDAEGTEQRRVMTLLQKQPRGLCLAINAQGTPRAETK